MGPNRSFSLRYRIPIIASCIFLILSAEFGFTTSVRASTNGQSNPAIVPGEVVITTQSTAQAGMLALPAGVSLTQTTPQLERLHAAVLKVPIGQEREYVQKLQTTSGVQFAELNYVVSTEDIIPNDPDWSQQYGPAHIQAPQAWSITTGSSNVTLAIIDSGIDQGHPEFLGRLVPGHDFVEGDEVPQDDCGHGTHVAGIAAATGNNRIGIAGMAWNVKIMAVRVLDGFCSGSTVSVAEALVWSVERGARVINLSLGTTAPSTLLESGTYYAYTHGAAIFAAAGNSGSSSVVYPAAYPWVMAVGATDQNDQRASFSNTGAALDLMAPGVDILSTTPDGNFFYKDLLNIPSRYGKLSGTSMASAFAAGTAALLASMPAFDTPDKIYQALTKTARDLDMPGRDDNTGYGLIQVYDALNYTPDIVPTPTPLPPGTNYSIQDSKTCANLVQYSWLDATNGTLLPIQSNDGYSTIAMPFAFILGDQSYANVTVSANGYITFGGDGSIRDNFIIPNFSQPYNFIAPFWDDLNPSMNGQIYQATIGEAPERKYVIEWYQVPRTGHTSADSQLTFEVALSERTNQVIFQYKTLFGIGADGSSATIGVEYADGRAGVEYSYNKLGAIVEGQALRFVPYSNKDVPPSDNCVTYTRQVGQTGGFFDPRPFCVDIPANALQHPAILQIQNLDHAPPLPPGLQSLNHFADISLNYSPPWPLSPFPEVYVCYHYTNSDLLHAGGHAENLSLAEYDSTNQSWEVLSTAANASQSLISARAPHLSIFSVVTTSSPAKLPVTGSFYPLLFKYSIIIFTILLGVAFLAYWRHRRKAPQLQ